MSSPDYWKRYERAMETLGASCRPRPDAASFRLMRATVSDLVVSRRSRGAVLGRFMIAQVLDDNLP